MIEQSTEKLYLSENEISRTAQILQIEKPDCHE
jgi:hypothetical protein